MAPKKKPQKGKGGKDEEEDTSTKDLLTYYKKYCNSYEISASKMVLAIINEACDEDIDIEEILTSESIGEFGAKALFGAMKIVKFDNYLANHKVISISNL